MKLTKIEQETIINFNEAERTASIYTHNEALKRQLLELCQSHPEQVRQTAANAWVLYCSKCCLKRCARE